MGQIIILGTASAVANSQQENTHFAILHQGQTILVDAPGSPVVRLERAGIELGSITDLILTHFHPDHVSGAPLLLMDMWLRGRKQLLRVHGPLATIDRFEQMLNLYEWQRWPGFFPVEFHRLGENETLPLVLEQPGLRVYAAMVKHLLPTIGLRIEVDGQPGHTIAYSCDTEPCEAVVQLGRGADILIHEATGESVGHSSPRQAGEIAQEAGAQCLYLIHYHPGRSAAEQAAILAEARDSFSGPVVLAKDFMVIDF